MFYSSVGPELMLYHIDVDACTLARQSTAVMPANVHYAWRHPTQPVLYVASSNGAAGLGGAAGDTHHATAWRIDRATGALAPHGSAATLRARPIHLSVDRAGEFVLIAYNKPSSVSVHRIARDGSLGEAVAQKAAPDAGIYAHQIRATPDNEAAILVTRGNDATAGGKEDPGALKLFIQHIETRGFHPRTFALDPTGRMLVAANLARCAVRDGGSVRMQPATLAVYRLGDDGRLAFGRSYAIDTGDALQFWSGMVAPA